MTCDSLNTERTAEQYVRGVVNMELGDEIIANILLDRHVSPDSLALDLSLRTKMLLKADVYMACSAMPSVAVSVDDADGNWRHKEGGGQISETDKRRWSAIANNIYAQYGEIRYASSGPRVRARGMRIWRKCHEDQ